MHPRIVVVGAGPAGLMAAGRAAEVADGQAEVLLLEKTPRAGNKLRLTGNGRCNLSHEGDASSFLARTEPTGVFLRNALARFYVPELRGFLAAHGVATHSEADGRIFPVSEHAEDVLGALQGYCRAQGVVLRTVARVVEIQSSARTGEAPWVTGVRLEDGTCLEAQRVILATGGLSYPRTGSSGDGYRMAAALGHTITPLRAGLVPLVTEEAWVPTLQGVSLRTVRISLLRGKKVLASERGDLLFTHWGLSGPTILNLSRHLGMDEGIKGADAGPVRLRLDLLPETDAAALDRRLQHDLAAPGKACYDSLLKGYVPRALGQVLIALSGIPGEQSLNQFTAAQRRQVAQLLKGLEITVVGPRPIQEAMVTLGGVSVREVAPRTLESRLVRGLYLAGELLDLAGDTGGYNLQIAFTTGWVAGTSSASM